jgi:hypothetical protein
MKSYFKCHASGWGGNTASCESNSTAVRNLKFETRPVKWSEQWFDQRLHSFSAPLNR